MSFTAMNFEDYCRMEAMGRGPAVVIHRTPPTVIDVRALLLPEQSECIADATIAWVIGESAKRYASVQHHDEWTALVAADAAFIIAGSGGPQETAAKRLSARIPPAWT